MIAKRHIFVAAALIQGNRDNIFQNKKAQNIHPTFFIKGVGTIRIEHQTVGDVLTFCF